MDILQVRMCEYHKEHNVYILAAPVHMFPFKTEWLLMMRLGSEGLLLPCIINIFSPTDQTNGDVNQLEMNRDDILYTLGFNGRALRCAKPTAPLIKVGLSPLMGCNSRKHTHTHTNMMSHRSWFRSNRHSSDEQYSQGRCLQADLSPTYQNKASVVTWRVFSWCKVACFDLMVQTIVMQWEIQWQ